MKCANSCKNVDKSDASVSRINDRAVSNVPLTLASPWLRTTPLSSAFSRSASSCFSSALGPRIVRPDCSYASLTVMLLRCAYVAAQAGTICEALPACSGVRRPVSISCCLTVSAICCASTYCDDTFSESCTNLSEYS